MRKVKFHTITVLSQDTRVLGATAGEWDAALTGNMARTLQTVKRIAQSGKKRSVADATTFDVASTVKRLAR